MTETNDMQEFLRKVKPELEQLEGIRIKKLAEYRIRRAIAILGGLFLCFAVIFSDWKVDANCIGEGCNNELGKVVMLLPVAVIAAGIFWWIKKTKQVYARIYKRAVLPLIAKLFGDFVYDVDGMISLQELQPSKLIPCHSCYKSGDCFEGHYKGTKIRFAEFYFEVPLWAKRGMRYKSLFEGLAILVDLKSVKFSGHTILVKNEGRMLQLLNEKLDGLRRAELVDPDFSKMFDVYTNDQVEARYLLDPKIIERYKDLAEIFKSKSMLAAYYNSSLLVMIPSKLNLFEPEGLYAGAENLQSVLRIKKEIEIIFKVIDYLELYASK